jgi:hypothetical protein
MVNNISYVGEYMWACEIIEENKQVYSFEGLRNVLACSLSRYDEFVLAAEQLSSMTDYEVRAYPFIPHDTIYIYDNEGISLQFKVKQD